MASPVQQLQQLLQKERLAAYIVPTSDAHQSEYVADCDKRREYVTKFTGSAGTALVINTENTSSEHKEESKHDSASDDKQKSLLWTDGRYFEQANMQLDSKQWQLMKAGLPNTPKLEDWSAEHLPAGSRIGVDATTLSVTQYKQMLEAFSNSTNDIQLQPTTSNLVDTVWSNARPAQPLKPVMLHPIKYSGESSSSKLERIRAKMQAAHVDSYVVTALDEICWLLNCRGSDIDFNPVFFAYVLVTHQAVTVYIDEQKLGADVQQQFKSDGFTVKPYTQVFSDIQAAKFSKQKRLWLDPSKTNVSIYHAALGEAAVKAIQADPAAHIDESALYTAKDPPIALMKAVKNETEVAGVRAAHLRDGAAVSNFLAWLEKYVAAGSQPALNEVTMADKLEQFRSQQKDFVGLSFDTIAGVGSNGAIIHYRAEPATAKTVSADELILLDSGGQYRDGTTDITRTFHLGQPTDWQKHTFTLVLKGHIGLARAVHPPTAVGPQLDILARQHLWNEGLNYGHGTGHGVGAYLNVHEGPHGIGATMKNKTVMETPLEVGMITSNEPGYYETGNFGIRIESLVVSLEAQTKHQPTGGKAYLTFETITLVPIQRKMIEVGILTKEELEWLNRYHAECREKLSPIVNAETREWLDEATKPIEAQH